MRITKLFVSVGLASASLTCVAAPDATIQAILTKNNCLACHAVDRKVVGPHTRTWAPSSRTNPAPLPCC